MKRRFVTQPVVKTLHRAAYEYIAPMKSLLITLISIATANVVAQEVVFSPEQIVFSEKNVRPVLAEHRDSCHGPEKAKSGLRLAFAGGGAAWHRMRERWSSQVILRGVL